MDYEQFNLQVSIEIWRNNQEKVSYLFRIMLISKLHSYLFWSIMKHWKRNFSKQTMLLVLLNRWERQGFALREKQKSLKKIRKNRKLIVAGYIKKKERSALGIWTPLWFRAKEKWIAVKTLFSDKVSVQQKSLCDNRKVILFADQKVSEELNALKN